MNLSLRLILLAGLLVVGCGDKTAPGVGTANNTPNNDGEDIGGRDAGNISDAGVDVGGPSDAGIGGDVSAEDLGRDVGQGDADMGDVCPLPTDLDLLILVDNSNTMTEEQAAFAAQLPRLIQALTSGDVDQDGNPDFPAFQSLNVGVVTTDMGTSSFTIPTCTMINGDDGVLSSEGNTDIASCMASYPNVQSYSGDATAFAQDVACVASAGIGGCGWEQPLESVLKAVTPAGSAISFQVGSGHADGANAGFLRPDSLLAVVMLTDEEDCSVEDPELFNPASMTYPGGLGLRCFEHPQARYRVSRYVDGLLATRSRPDLLVFGLIAGVPTTLATQDFATILADPSMQEMIDPSAPNRLVPSCDDPGRGIAFPPRRLVRTGEMLDAAGAATVVGSICQDDLSAPVDRLLGAIALRATSCP